jgi:hypothetical protein
MSGHRAILPYVSRKIALAIIILVGVSAPYQYLTGEPSDVFGVFLSGFLLLWLAAWAGRELHELEREELEHEIEMSENGR